MQLPFFSPIIAAAIAYFHVHKCVYKCRNLISILLYFPKKYLSQLPPPPITLSLHFSGGNERFSTPPASPFPWKLSWRFIHPFFFPYRFYHSLAHIHTHKHIYIYIYSLTRSLTHSHFYLILNRMELHFRFCHARIYKLLAEYYWGSAGRPDDEGQCSFVRRGYI